MSESHFNAEHLRYTKSGAIRLSREARKIIRDYKERKQIRGGFLYQVDLLLRKAFKLQAECDKLAPEATEQSALELLNLRRELRAMSSQLVVDPSTVTIDQHVEKILEQAKKIAA